MIYPLIISPEFLIKIKDDENLLDKFNDFIKHYREFWKDIFILIDDENNNLNAKYKEIQNNYVHESYLFNVICDFLIQTEKTKKIKLNKIFENDDQIIDYLRNNKVNIDNIIKFTDSFNKKQISIKDTIGKVPLTELTNEDAIEKITSITRFSKNVALIDPMITHNLTNIDYKYRNYHENDCTKIESTSHKDDNCCSYSIKKIVKAIYDTNLFKKELKIHIRTTVSESKIQHFKDKIIKNVKKWRFFEYAENKGNKNFFWPLKKNYKTNKFEKIEGKTKEYETLWDGMKYHSLIKKKTDESDTDFQERLKKSSVLKVLSREEILKNIENWHKIGDFIHSTIDEFTSNILDNIKPNVLVNQHYKNNEKKEDNDIVQDIYARHILALDLDSSIEIRKGLDIFDPKIEKLRNMNSWFLKLDTNKYEKSASFYIFNHQKFKPTEIIFN